MQGQVLRSFSIPVTDPPTNLRVFRDEIARQLIDEAQRLFPDTIHFHFSCPVQAVDTDKQTVTISNDSSQQVNFCTEPVLSMPSAFTSVPSAQTDCCCCSFARDSLMLTGTLPNTLPFRTATSKHKYACMYYMYICMYYMY